MPEWLFALLGQAAAIAPRNGLDEGARDQCVHADPPGDAILVTVAHAEGSVPRLPGARMVFTATHQHDTIGGGHLEWKAAAIARRMLAEAAPAGTAYIERLPLGPSLGQCCGGVVWLAFERIDDAARQPFREIVAAWSQGRASERRIRIGMAGETGAKVRTVGTVGAGGAGELARILRGALAVAPAVGEPGEAVAAAVPQTRIEAADGSFWLLDTVTPYPNRLVLFGAGHVGAALVRVLHGVPCQIHWVDPRENLFPTMLPANVWAEATDTPEAVIDAAPADSCFLVMTHSHALDLQLTEAILRRQAFRWFGLIGSKTKRASFEHRLGARGIDEATLRRLCCPIGLPGIKGKEPAVIALAIAAQLLQIWQSPGGAVAAGDSEPHAAAATHSQNTPCGAAR